MQTLKEIEDYANEVAGQWNGDLPGTEEERATTAYEILEKLKELKQLLEELN